MKSCRNKQGQYSCYFLSAIHRDATLKLLPMVPRDLIGKVIVDDLKKEMVMPRSLAQNFERLIDLVPGIAPLTDRMKFSIRKYQDNDKLIVST